MSDPINPTDIPTRTDTEPRESAAQLFGDWPEVAGYDVIGMLGRGGMGIVYQARQLGLNRPVALKMILAGRDFDPEERRRFNVEAEAVAALAHPNIVQVYEVGSHNGAPFFSLELCGAGSLASRLNGTPLPGREAAALLEPLARGIHAAHQRQVIHRDIKPGNVLLAGEPAAPLERCTPKISDFGLAKKLDRDSVHTRSGAVLGTPSYMAPEQVRGHVRELGPACDVYGLGAVLYELVTGRPPFKAETPLDTMSQVLDQEPVPPRLLNPKIDRDLETICLKCLEKDPRRRYPSANDLAGDLDRYLRGEAISSRSYNVVDRITRLLEQDRLGDEFRSWGTMLLWFAAIVFGCHLIIFAFQELGWPAILRVLMYGVQFSLIFLAWWRYRSPDKQPTGAGERQLWAIWVGYVAFCYMNATVLYVLNGPASFSELQAYPLNSAAAGMAFLCMGGRYWGRHFLHGLAFYVLGFVMLFDLRWSIIEYGTLWALVLVDIGIHVRRQAVPTLK